MRLMVTGDTHNTLDIYKLQLLDDENLTSNDYVIITGDFGVPCFGETLDTDSMLQFYKDKPYTTLFVDGNHENFPELEKLPIETWNGGKVHKLADNVIHLMRGQVFTIGGKKIFTFGGASSIDKHLRVPDYTWFDKENCSKADEDEALSNLAKHNNKVDIIITHTCGAEYMERNAHKFGIRFYKYYTDTTERFLDYIEDIVNYKHWYFGHYHFDVDVDSKHTALLDVIKEIK